MGYLKYFEYECMAKIEYQHKCFIQIQKIDFSDQSEWSVVRADIKQKVVSDVSLPTPQNNWFAYILIYRTPESKSVHSRVEILTALVWAVTTGEDKSGKDRMLTLKFGEKLLLETFEPRGGSRG